MWTRLGGGRKYCGFTNLHVRFSVALVLIVEVLFFLLWFGIAREGAVRM